MLRKNNLYKAHGYLTQYNTTYPHEREHCIKIIKPKNNMITDIEIARNIELENINIIAKKLGISQEQLLVILNQVQVLI